MVTNKKSFRLHIIHRHAHGFSSEKLEELLSSLMTKFQAESDILKEFIEEVFFFFLANIFVNICYYILLFFVCALINLSRYIASFISNYNIVMTRKYFCKYKYLNTNNCNKYY